MVSETIALPKDERRKLSSEDGIQPGHRPIRDAVGLRSHDEKGARVYQKGAQSVRPADGSTATGSLAAFRRSQNSDGEKAPVKLFEEE